MCELSVMNKEHLVACVRSRRDVFPLAESKFAKTGEKKFASISHRKKSRGKNLFNKKE